MGRRGIDIAFSDDERANGLSRAPHGASGMVWSRAVASRVRSSTPIPAHVPPNAQGGVGLVLLVDPIDVDSRALWRVSDHALPARVVDVLLYHLV